MLRDDDAFPMPLRSSISPESLLIEQNTPYVNDDLDDVFGSDPGSPIAGNDELRGGNVEQSDIPRLKEKHETEGYRDGVTKGKADSVQAGFDEGYGLGAVLGLRVGRILGLLEAIYAAVCAADGEEWKAETERLEALVERGKEELSTKSVFGREWWGEDGIWKFDVPGEAEGKEVLFPDVAMAHPLAVKWEKAVEEEVSRWGLDLGIMDRGQGDGDDDGDDGEEEYRTQHLSPADGKEVAAEPVASSTGLFMGIPKKDLNW